VRGEVIASSGSSWVTGRRQTVRIIRTSTGKFVVAIQYETQWQGEHNTDEAAVLPSLKQIVEYLSGRVPGWMLQELIEELGEEAIAEEIE